MLSWHKKQTQWCVRRFTPVLNNLQIICVGKVPTYHMIMVSTWTILIAICLVGVSAKRDPRECEGKSCFLFSVQFCSVHQCIDTSYERDAISGCQQSG